MTLWHKLRIVLPGLVMLGLLLCARPAGWGQIQTGSGSTPLSGGQSNHHPLDDDLDPMHGQLPQSYARMQNTERQRKLVSDTERLLYLTNQLKASIEDSGGDALSPEMLRQMDEIEKLARSVKNKMRN